MATLEPTAFQRDVRDFLLDNGATSVRLVSGGKHPRFQFDHGGRPRQYVVPGTPGDNARSLLNIIRDLRGLLALRGAPQQQKTAKTRRHLDDMLPAAPAGPALAPLVFMPVAEVEPEPIVVLPSVPAPEPPAKPIAERLVRMMVTLDPAALGLAA